MDLHIETVPIDTLVPYEGNAKLHPKKQIEQIAHSIQEFGNCDPIGVWTHPQTGTTVIVEGHGRYQALLSLGHTEIPIIRLDHLTDEQRRAYTLAHNQLTLNSGWDDDILKIELEQLDSLFDMQALGFPELHDIPQDIDDTPIKDDIDARTKTGDVWHLGNHRLVCGDATDPQTIETLLEGAKIDLWLTDPPYGVDYVGKTADALTIQNDANNDIDLENLLNASFTIAVHHMKPGASFYIFHADSKGLIFRNAVQNAGLNVRQNLIWLKNTMVLGRQDYQWQHEPCLYGWKEGASHQWYGGRKQTTVLEYNKPSVNAEHPTMKPVNLLAKLISNSTKKGDTILDTFAGSGSTLIAAENLQRVAYCTELDPHYCDVIINRWESLTGKQATLAV